MKNRTLILIAFMFIGLNQIQAQQTVEDLVGLTASTWSGEGYQMTQDGKRIEFSQTETVAAPLNGKLLTFNGKGSENGSDEVGFEAFGVMFTEAETGKVKMHAWTKDGRYTLADVFIEPDGFYWQFEVPGGGTVRYDIEISGDTWSESGKYSPPNSDEWYPFMAMNLEKQPD